MQKENTVVPKGTIGAKGGEVQSKPSEKTLAYSTKKQQEKEGKKEHIKNDLSKRFQGINKKIIIIPIIAITILGVIFYINTVNYSARPTQIIATDTYLASIENGAIVSVGFL